jgi:hypothetical protein
MNDFNNSDDEDENEENESKYLFTLSSLKRPNNSNYNIIENSDIINVFII